MEKLRAFFTRVQNLMKDPRHTGRCPPDDFEAKTATESVLTDAV